MCFVFDLLRPLGAIAIRASFEEALKPQDLPKLRPQLSSISSPEILRGVGYTIAWYTIISISWYTITLQGFFESSWEGPLNYSRELRRQSLQIHPIH